VVYLAYPCFRGGGKDHDAPLRTAARAAAKPLRGYAGACETVRIARQMDEYYK